MAQYRPWLRAVFFCTVAGREPVREWLRGLDKEARRVLGEDIKTIQLSWPVGMPLVRSLGDGLWELRRRLPRGQARVVFFVENDLMVLLHGFVKKSRKTPKNELKTARSRAAQLRGERGL